MTGLEWLSTALWHLQQEVELSALAHDLITTERQQYATWIAAGNCFSLNKEHETAIKFFERAIQVNKRLVAATSFYNVFFLFFKNARWITTVLMVIRFLVTNT